jgi:hypothetical protein
VGTAGGREAATRFPIACFSPQRSVTLCGFSCVEIAGIMGVNERTVMTRLARAIVVAPVSGDENAT